VDEQTSDMADFNEACANLPKLAFDEKE
jgi:hypothetical protein